MSLRVISFFVFFSVVHIHYIRSRSTERRSHYSTSMTVEHWRRELVPTGCLVKQAIDLSFWWRWNYASLFSIHFGSFRWLGDTNGHDKW